jgi:hypothetical protein
VLVADSELKLYGYISSEKVINEDMIMANSMKGRIMVTGLV